MKKICTAISTAFAVITVFAAPNRNYYLSYANELESGELSKVWF